MPQTMREALVGPAPTPADMQAARTILRQDIVDAVILAQKERGDAVNGDNSHDMQVAIDRGMWGLDGSFGRAMMAVIESGACMLGPKATKDYYGNTIPGRYDVQAGTKGSPEYALAYWGGE